MEKENSNLPTRRQVLQVSGTLAAGTILPNIGFGNVHVDGNETIQVAIVGCGGRGGGAVANALSTTSGPIKLVAMADVFADRLESCHAELVKNFSSKMEFQRELFIRSMKYFLKEK